MGVTKTNELMRHWSSCKGGSVATGDLMYRVRLLAELYESDMARQPPFLIRF